MFRNKIIPFMLVMVGFLLMTWNSNASTINAVSCSQTNVQAAISSATAGDAVLIPAGSCTWTSGISLGSKKVKITGAGIGSTVITASGLSVAAINLGTGGSTLTDITLKNGFIQVAGQGFVVGKVMVSYATGIGTAINVYFGDGDHPTGVIHSCQFVNSDVNVVGGGASMDAGQSYRWAQPQQLGSTGIGDSANGIVYIEDNTFTRSIDTAQQMNAIDANYGARYVFRYNTLNTTSAVTTGNLAFYAEAHSVQGVNRGTQRWEIYGNLLNNQGNYHYYPFSLRSGTGVVFNNGLLGNWTNKAVGVDNRRSTETFATCGTCNGTSLWDGNTGTAGYPCRDQIGRGHDTTLWKYATSGAYTQVSMPAYAWNNRDTASNNLAPMQVKNSSYATHIQANRDFYTHTVSFNGTSGVGCGTLANRPTSCTKGVAYWATNQNCSNLTGMVGANPANSASGTLYKCTATNTWTSYFTPAAYPHPLRNWSSTYLVGTYDHASGWALETGKTYTYSMVADQAFIGKQVAKVLQGSTQYKAAASKDLVESTAGSYYYDTSAGKLYVRCTTNVNPNSYLITVYFKD